MVTLAALIARDQTAQMNSYLSLALDNGVKPSEISEIITHLAFYSGWGKAMAAVVCAREVFQERGIGPDQLPPARAEFLPLNEAAEKQRAATVEQNFDAIAAGVVQYTTDVLFRDLWLRPALTPRDRSLVTVSALIASGQVAQVSYHLNRAMDNGLTQREASRNSRKTGRPAPLMMPWSSSHVWRRGTPRPFALPRRSRTWHSMPVGPIFFRRFQW